MSEPEAVDGAALAAFGVLVAGFAAGSAVAGGFADTGAAGSAVVGVLAVASAAFAFLLFFAFVAVAPPADESEPFPLESFADVASPAFDFLLFFFFVEVSADAPEVMALLSAAACLLLDFDFLVFDPEALVPVASPPVAAAPPAVAFSFFDFFLDFLVAVPVLVASLAVCAFTTGTTVTANMKQKKTIHKLIRFLE
jgi:hypothetical protein